MLKKKNVFFIIIAVITILLIFFLTYKYNPFSVSINNKTYDRAVYSVVVHNNTNKILNDIHISYGNDINIQNSTVLFYTVNNIKPNEYRKINIPTKYPSDSAEPPYNVWLSVQDESGIMQNYGAGYFGIDTGGLAVFDVKIENDTFNFQRVFQHEKMYKYIHKRNKKNQQELSWYD